MMLERILLVTIGLTSSYFGLRAVVTESGKTRKTCRLVDRVYEMLQTYADREIANRDRDARDGLGTNQRSPAQSECSTERIPYLELNAGTWLEVEMTGFNHADAKSGSRLPSDPEVAIA